MSTVAIPTYLDGIEAHVADLLVRGGHVADGDEIRTAVVRVDAEVIRHRRQGALTIDAALGAVAAVLADRVSTRILRGREPAEALVELAVVHELECWPTPVRWFEVSCLDGIA